MTRSLLAAALLVGALAACTTDDPGEPADAGPTPAAETPTAPAERWSAADVRVDRVPARPPLLRTDLPASFPADDAALPSVLDDPPGRAVLAYSPRETFDDTGGWATERVLLLGDDGAWRSLDLVDLGLPEDTWQGVDTYGAGYLSPDGRTWMGRHGGGVVLLDLDDGTSRTVPLPGGHTAYAAWHPSSRSFGVVRHSGRSTYRSWVVDAASGRAERASYRLPIDGYAVDGTVVTFLHRGDRVMRIGHGTRDVLEAPVPVPWSVVRLGGAVGTRLTALGQPRSLLVVDNATFEPVARLASGRSGATGWPRGWLDDDTFYATDSRHGLLAWDVGTGEVRTLVRPQGAYTPNAWWSASVAADLLPDGN